MSSLGSNDAKAQKLMENSDEDEEAVRELDCEIKGMKKYSVLDSVFIIPERYNIIEPIGTGAYGLVVAAIDSEKLAEVEEEE